MTVRTERLLRPAGGALAAAAVATLLIPTATGLAEAAPAQTSAAKPAGAQRLEHYRLPGISYSRYQSTSLSPAQVVAFYSARLSTRHYAVRPGLASGTEATLTAKKGKRRAAVQATVPKGSSPTVFEVCTGTKRAAVAKCDSRSSAS